MEFGTNKDESNGLKVFGLNLLRFLKTMFNFRFSFLPVIVRKDYCSIHPMTKIHEPFYLYYVSLDKGSYISKFSHISYTHIGKYCSIGPNLLAGWGIHPINGLSTSPVFYSQKNQNGFSYARENKVEERSVINIGNDVFIGANVTILDGVTIGDGAVIGAGAVVNKDIPPYAVAVGCPISIIKYRFDEATIQTLLSIKWWDQGEEIHKMMERNFFDIGSFLQEYNGSILTTEHANKS